MTSNYYIIVDEMSLYNCDDTLYNFDM